MIASFRLRRAARTHFGWAKLRPTQLAAMKSLLRGKDVLAVLPTGAGKSAIYQVPATLRNGPTIVISPLLALQHDQLVRLNEQRDGQAVRISSAETPAQQQEALRQLQSGQARFLFITPEQLAKPQRRTELAALRPALVAVDEAHCVSTWGDDFRPDYVELGAAIRELGRPPIVALTATASPPVRDDIVERLGLRKPRTVISGLDRPNIRLEVVHCQTEDVRWRRLLTMLEGLSGQGIIYVPTRRIAEELATKLTKAGRKTTHYHGGMAAGMRSRRHTEFLSGQSPVMVATSAFGMGIDKADLRWVVHVGLPGSPDNYLQEIGRAGRDGQPARAVLLWRPEDVSIHRYFAQSAGDRRALHQSRVDMMRAFADSRGCRVRPLLGYFGEQLRSDCGHCDNCLAGLSVTKEHGAEPFPVHSSVQHASWGTGMVLSYEEDRMTVLFDDVGYKTLSVTVVQANSLLSPAT